MQTNMETSKTSKLVFTAMTMCMIVVAILILRIPIPFTQGYVNLSDAIIFIGVFILGCKYGAAAAALGSTLGDIVGGFAMWAPWTFFIKGGMALIAGLMLNAVSKNRDISKKKSIALEIAAMTVAGLFMTGGYYVAEGVMYGNWIVALLGVPWNMCQFAVGMVLALILTEALMKTSFRKYLIAKRR